MPTADEIGVDSVVEVLTTQYGLDGEEHGDEFLLTCPNPGHSDSHPSCGVNLKTGLFHCFACGVGGDLIRLGTLVLGLSREAVEEALKPHSTEALLSVVQRKLGNLRLTTMPSRKKDIKLPGPYRSGPLDALLERDFREDTLQKWGVRFCLREELQGKKGPFEIRNSIAIPIRDADGNLLCWCYRATKDSPGWQPKYLYTPEVDISRFWFGLQHNSKSENVVVVEGALDAMWLDQCGFPALALLGSQMPEAKIKQLQRYKSVTILGDRDASGAIMVQKIGNILGDRMPVYVARYSTWMGADDPQQMNPVDLEIMLMRSIPWTRFRLLNRQ
jgi:DNA primase